MNGTPQGTSFQGRPVLVLAGGCEYMISLGAIFFRGAYLSGHTGRASAVNRPRRRPPSRCDLLVVPGPKLRYIGHGNDGGGAALDEGDVSLFLKWIWRGRVYRRVVSCHAPAAVRVFRALRPVQVVRSLARLSGDVGLVRIDDSERIEEPASQRIARGADK
jgi:hypothetical protein